MGTDEVKNDTGAGPELDEVVRQAEAAGRAARARLDEAAGGGPSSRKRRLTPAGAKLIVGTFAAGCVYFLAALPKPVLPREGPVLHLDAAAVAAAQRESERRIETLEPSDALSDLRRLVRDQRRREARSRELTMGDAPDTTHEARMAALAEAAAAVVADAGEAALDGFVADELNGLRRVLGGLSQPEAEEAEVGSFPRMLDRYGLAREGELVAPPIVVESLFKATVNAILQRELTAGFAPVEHQAYWGWLAFREGGDAAQRRAAAARYEEAGGDARTVLELEAWLAFREGKTGEAAQLYRRLEEETGSLRARNHVLALTGML